MNILDVIVPGGEKADVFIEIIYFTFFSPIITSGSFCDIISQVSGTFKDNVIGSLNVVALSTSNTKLKYEPGAILLGIFTKLTFIPLCAVHKIEQKKRNII